MRKRGEEQTIYLAYPDLQCLQSRDMSTGGHLNKASGPKGLGLWMLHNIETPRGSQIGEKDNANE